MSFIQLHRASRLPFLAALLFGAFSPCAPPCCGGVKYALIVCGHPGDAEHQTLYADSITRMRQALIDRFAFAAEHVWIRCGVTGDAGATPEWSRGPAERTGMEQDVRQLGATMKADDELWVIVLGHAHAAERTMQLNLPGPDVAAAEFASWFADMECRRSVFIATTPLSGYLLQPLAGHGRVVIAATEPDLEANETLYHASLAKMWETIGADSTHDLDHDGAISLLDLHLAVVHDVEATYQREKLFATEHAQLDDNGDGRGSELQWRFPKQSPGSPPIVSRAPPHDQEDGALARNILLFDAQDD